MQNIKNGPHPLTAEEWTEIAAVPAIRELWGLATDDGGSELAAVAYAARFDFVSGGPGYIGDLYLVQGDALGGGPVALTRNGGELRLVELG